MCKVIEQRIWKTHPLPLAILWCMLINLVRSQESANLRGHERTLQTSNATDNPPNVILFIVDDLGWNQVGYHAAPVGNYEIKTPHIDAHAAAGVTLERGYMTPWCGPSRAAIMTGRTNIYNANVTNGLFSFDDDIGYVAGLAPNTETIATAFKRYGQSIGKNYTALYNGKWGIGGAAWHNTPIGAGFDYFRGSFGNGIETCDGLIPTISTIAPYRPLPFDKDFGPLMVNTLKAYWEQDLEGPDSDLCPYFQSHPLLSAEERAIACKTIPRTPPKIIDSDLLDNVEEQILSHDYENAGPILQIFSTMMLHLPLAYPAEYNEAEANDNFTNGMPVYFANDEVKPPANNDDNRWATNQGVRFVDDLFGRTMQAIKDAGQWNNTIVYFTSDNGGVVYHGTANNNYPLRASKFSPFEGGIRVPQFISGGWIENQQLPSKRPVQSNTYIFPNDLAPTLLEMAGAQNASSFLHGSQTGAPYGNAMWEYIKNSLDPTKPVSSHQKIRKVSYSKDMFFDVQVDRTIKHFFTGDYPFLVPRLYEPVWPKNGDLVMDTVYMSINPCRLDGRPLDCCNLNIEEDWQERNPMPENCQAMHLEAKNLFEIEGGCPKNEDGRNLNKVCFEEGEISDGTSPNNLSLWSHYGAAGPFVNSKGQPLKDLPMKCACYGLIDGASASDVDYFVVRNMGPSQCGKAGPLLSLRPTQSVECDGSFSFGFPPKENILNDYSDEGFSWHYQKTLDLEKNQLLPIGTLAALKAMVSYMERDGYTDWPSMGKFPFNGAMDTCKEKNVVTVPFPVQAITPYMFGTRDPSIPFEELPFIGLCSPATATQYFCPSHQNAELKGVVRWSFNKLNLHGVFVDDSKWKPMGLIECTLKCRRVPEGTAYIGDGPHGLVV